MSFKPAVRNAAPARIAIASPSGAGKAQPVDAPVLTPEGWRPIGDLTVGDPVYTPSGFVTAVTAVHPQGVQQIYRLTFTDGSTAESTADHLWVTQTILDRGARGGSGRPGSAKHLTEIMDTLRDRNGKRNHWVQMVDPIDFPESPADLPLDPWLVGALLGDGCLTARGLVMCKPDDDFREMVSRALPNGSTIGWHRDGSFGIVGVGGRNTALDAVRTLGLHGLRSTEKHVPHAYLWGSGKTRAAVLAGLLDTDGFADGHTCEFSTSSEQLARDVRFLVQSLGGTCSTSSRIPHYRGSDGTAKDCAQNWRLNICPPAGINPFRLARKADRFTPRSKYPARRGLDSVEPTRMADAVCISVADESRMYITSEFLPTHNSYTSLMLAHAMGKRIAAVDTERGSLSKYVGHNGWAFDVEDPDKYDPQALAKTIHEAATAGYDVLIVDSLTHYWNGQGGMLELADKLVQGHDKRSGWRNAGDREKAMIDALLGFPGHVIVTMRTKNEQIIEENDRGKKVVVDVVLKPVQREGIEYEFDFVATMDKANTLTVQKSRILTIAAGETFSPPTPELAITILDYLGNGEPVPSPQEFADRAMVEGLGRAELREILNLVHRVGYDGAGVLDAGGDSVGLRDLIVRLGTMAAA